MRIKRNSTLQENPLSCSMEKREMYPESSERFQTIPSRAKSSKKWVTQQGTLKRSWLRLCSNTKPGKQGINPLHFVSFYSRYHILPPWKQCSLTKPSLLPASNFASSQTKPETDSIPCFTSPHFKIKQRDFSYLFKAPDSSSHYPKHSNQRREVGSKRRNCFKYSYFSFQGAIKRSTHKTV